VIPLSKGGKHEIGNIQAAHLGCNISKGARLAGDRRRRQKAMGNLLIG
jgi:5-methylcytosine-specific restriction endonuclease McrA